MANRMLPLLYLNLGGEMMYILEQRLVAQNLGDKSSKGMFMKNAVIVYCQFLIYRDLNYCSNKVYSFDFSAK